MSFKLTKLKVEGFRAFPDNIEFIFPAQLVVIYGRNGRGKSTIFDAISWLFDGDLLKYQDYGREWNRCRLSHTRSILNPDQPSKVTCNFKDESNNSEATIIRTEDDKPMFSQNINGWFGTANSKNRPLANHMLCQVDLQKIAKAKGRDRLEALAPILDLTQYEQQIRALDDEIKDKSDRRKIVESDLTTVDDQSVAISFSSLRIRASILLNKARSFNIDVIPYNGPFTNDQEELMEWLKWSELYGASLSNVKNIIADEIGHIKAKYNIEYYEQSNILSLEEKSSLKLSLIDNRKKIADSKRIIAEIDDTVLRLELDIIEVRKQIEKYERINNELFGDFFKSTDDFERAISYYNRVIETEPQNTDALNNLGIAMNSKGHYDRAIVYFNQVIKIDPNDAKALNNLGDAMNRKGNYDRAISYYKQAIEIEPHKPHLFNSIGNVYKSKGDYDRAFEYYSQAIKIDSQNVDAFSNLGNVMYSKGCYVEAISYYKKAIEIEPHKAKVFNNLGNVYKSMCEYDLAISCYNQAIKQDPNNAFIYNNLGSAFQSKNNYYEAVNCYCKAIEMLLAIPLFYRNTSHSALDNETNTAATYENKINDIKEISETFSKKLRELEWYRSTAMETIDKIIGLYLDINNNIRVVRENESWLNENKVDLDTRELQKLKSELEILTLESQEKIAWINEIQLHRKRLYNANENGICPLCGHNHSSMELLIKSFDDKARLWENSISSFSENIREASDKLSRLQFLVIEREKRFQEIDQAKISTRAADEEIKDQIKCLKALPIWDSKVEIMVENKDWEILKDVLVQRINGLITNTMVEIEKVDNCLKSFVIYKSELQRNEERAKDLQIDMAKIEQILYSYAQNYRVNGFELSAMNYETLLLGLNDLFEKEKQKQVNIQDYFRNLERNLLENEYRWFRALNSELYRLDDEITSILIGFREMIISTQETLQKTGRKVQYEKEVTRLSTSISKAKQRRQILKKAQQEEINRTIGPLSRRIGTLFETLTGESIWKTVTAHAFVPDQKERTNLIFEPLTKSPNITKNTKNINSTFLFSMGEFSVLGLSTFLAQATEKANQAIGKGPDLNSLFIDDPIQELDCIRDDALTYLLCDIALERQVIVSTSNLDFANRLILSSRPMWERYPDSCGVLYLNKKGNYSPEVQYTQPEKWISDQGIYMPKIKRINDSAY